MKTKFITSSITLMISILVKPFKINSEMRKDEFILSKRCTMFQTDQTIGTGRQKNDPKILFREKNTSKNHL